MFFDMSILICNCCFIVLLLNLLDMKSLVDNDGSV